MQDHTIRLSQLIANFGTGAVYDVLGESLVLKDTSYWERTGSKGRELNADRLISSLQASGFAVDKIIEPATTENRRAGSGMPYMRFPSWLFCARCRKMVKWHFSMERPGSAPVCSSCPGDQKLSPMRFILICDHGHMGDMNWVRWAHSQPQNGKEKSCGEETLEFLTGQTGSGGLESVAVRCRSCGAGRSLENITLPHALAEARIFCPGRQPWERRPETLCDRPPHAVQRGAGNVYYPLIRSAITIPPESYFGGRAKRDPLAEVLSKNEIYRMLSETNPAGDFRKLLVKRLCDQYSCTSDDIERVLGAAAEKTAAPLNPPPDIETEELLALITENPEADDRDQFVTRHHPVPESWQESGAGGMIGRIVSVIKLREVRALAGYYRYHPGGGEDSSSPGSLVQPDLGRGLTWLPGTEVYGEGIFLSLNEEALTRWENDKAVIARIGRLRKRVADSSFARLLPEASPRFILLHTLAHLLIRRLAFESGYASASLRERIYARSPERGAMAGVLIYTAAGDAEGTLGGLARQALPENLLPVLLSALRDAAGCSSDPICSETAGQGLDSLNLAACHACSLVAETSCTSFNLLLDRVTVAGDGETPGFFDHVISYHLERTLRLNQS